MSLSCLKPFDGSPLLQARASLAVCPRALGPSVRYLPLQVTPGDRAEKPPSPLRTAADVLSSSPLQVLSLPAQDRQDTVWTVGGTDKLGQRLG